MNNVKENKLVIIGGGNQTRVCIDIIKRMGTFEIAGIIYTRVKPTGNLMGLPIAGHIDDLPGIYRDLASNAVVGIGGLDNPTERTELFDKLKAIGFNIPNIIHPQAIIEPSASLGEGNQVMGGANIGSCCVIGSNCIINSNVVVSHDCVIGDNVNIAPGAVLAGTVKVGDNTMIGVGAVMRHGITIGSNVVVGAGSVVLKDIPDNITVVGNPARELQRQQS